MGKGSAKMEVNEYRMSMHLGVCQEVDVFKRIIIGEKDAWVGSVSTQGGVLIDQPDLFGGPKKEGGVRGTAYFLPGKPDQVLPNSLATRLGRSSGADCPGFRGLASIFFVASGAVSDNPGTVIDVWKDNTYSGTHGNFTGPIPDLTAYGLGDNISSVKAQGRWQVFEHDHYGGQSAIVEGNLPDPFPSGHPLHDKISSLAPEGYAGEGGAGGFYWVANNPYLKDIAVEVLRAPKGLDPAYALIPRADPDLSASFLGDFTGLAWQFACGVHFGGPVFGCFTSGTASDAVVMGGNPGTTYTATFRIRGVVELNGFSGGTQLSPSYVKSTPSDTPLSGIAGINHYKLTISDPPVTYYLNHSDTAVDPPPNLVVLDFPLTVEIAGGATVTLSANSIDSTEISNIGNLSAPDDDASKPIVVSQPYDGQFMQMDATGVGTAFDANPAHMIYELLTNREWGMGSPLALIDTGTFNEVAVKLYSEGLGLSMLWTRQDTVENFVSEILKHIQATVFVNPRTGLLSIKLIRADYEPDDLRVITPDNAKLSNFQRKSWGEIANEVVVTWTNPATEQDETVTAQDNAGIATQGSIVSTSRNFYGVRSATLAMNLAARELRAAVAPLASCDVELDRRFWDLLPGDVQRMTWPERGITDMVMRVGPVDYGRPGDPTIKASLVEDVFGFAIGDFSAPPGSSWESEDATPVPMAHQRVITVPTFLALNYTTDPATYPEVLAGVLASSETALSYDVYGPSPLPGGGTTDEVQSTNTVLGYATLVGALIAEAESSGVTFTGFMGRVRPGSSVFVVIGADDDDMDTMEFAMVSASVGDEYVLSRGLLDTIPREWAAGTPVWFLTVDSDISDLDSKSDGETVTYKLLSRTFGGVLDPGLAPTVSGTMNARPWLPIRPADVKVYGEAWSSETALIDARSRPDPWVTAVWANRNRTMEDSQVLLWTDATVTPEDGQTTTIEIFDVDGIPVFTHDGLTGSTFDIPDASFSGNAIVRLKFSSARTDDDGDFVSLQSFEHWLQLASIKADSTEVTADSTHFTADEN